MSIPGSETKHELKIPGKYFFTLRVEPREVWENLTKRRIGDPDPLSAALIPSSNRILDLTKFHVHENNADRAFTGGMGGSETRGYVLYKGEQKGYAGEVSAFASQLNHFPALEEEIGSITQGVFELQDVGIVPKFTRKHFMESDKDGGWFSEIERISQIDQGYLRLAYQGISRKRWSSETNRSALFWLTLETKGKPQSLITAFVKKLEIERGKNNHPHFREYEFKELI